MIWMTLALSLVASIYIICRLILPLRLKKSQTILLSLLLVAMCAMLPIYMHIQHTETPLTYAVGSVGRIIVGFISLLLTATIIKDLATLVLLLLTRLVGYYPIRSGAKYRARGAGAAVLLAALVSLGVGYYQSQHPEIVEVDITIKDLPSELDGFTIAQISDLHVTRFTSKEWLERVVDMVNSQSVDIVAVTGDLADLNMPDSSGALDYLSELSSRYGSYFAVGNHEFYGGQIYKKLERIAELGMITLNNSSVIIEHNGKNILIGGVVDEQGEHQGFGMPDPIKSIECDTTYSASVLLSHRPTTIYDAARAGYDLQISGHTHNGQFFPWNLIVGSVQEHMKGLYEVDGAQLYVNQGVGFWGIPVKLGSTPEITIITLK